MVSIYNYQIYDTFLEVIVGGHRKEIIYIKNSKESTDKSWELISNLKKLDIKHMHGTEQKQLEKIQFLKVRW